MNPEKIKELLDRVPITLFLVIYILYLGYDYHLFKTDPRSGLNLEKAKVEKAENEVKKLKTRVKEVSEFVKSLEAKKAELRGLAQDLDSTKATLSESLDIPAFMKVVLTEAKKMGLTVLALKPTLSSVKEYYVEQAFELTFKGVFVQFIGFLERLANLEKIVRVDDFVMTPTKTNSSRYIELEGKLQLKTFRYNGSKADDLAKEKPKTEENKTPISKSATPPSDSGKAGSSP